MENTTSTPFETALRAQANRIVESPILPNNGRLNIDLAAYDRIVSKARETVIRKNLDYSGERAGDNITATGLQGIAVRLVDKVHRLLTLSQPGREAYVKDESIQDTLGDILNYAVIGQMLLQKEWGQPRTEGVPLGATELLSKMMLAFSVLYDTVADTEPNEDNTPEANALIDGVSEFLETLSPMAERFPTVVASSVMERLQVAKIHVDRIAEPDSQSQL